VATPASLAKRGPVMGSRFNPAPPIPLNADGTFEIAGLPPGAFLFQLTGPGVGPTGWWMKSMTTGGRDLLDRLIEVRPGSPSINVVVSMSDRHTELSGTLRTSTGQPEADVFVIAFSSDRTMWGPGARRVRAVRPGADGRFSIPDLPPGDYLLGVMTDVDQEDWQNPALLDQLVPTSVKVTIGEGEKKVQDLQLGKGPRESFRGQTETRVTVFQCLAARPGSATLPIEAGWPCELATLPVRRANSGSPHAADLEFPQPRRVEPIPASPAVELRASRSR